jgi:hypothetical protein
MEDVEYVLNDPHPDGLVGRHRVLLERVAKLERALEEIAELQNQTEEDARSWEPDYWVACSRAGDIAQEALSD